MALTPGTRLGPYELAEPLGAGGMGEVYRATDTRLGRTVAIKVLPGHVAGDEARKIRFEREAQAVAALNHPHICVLHDVGRHDPSTLSTSSGQAGSGQAVDFLVMEYLDGETLASRLEKGPIPFEQALRYAVQVADALDKAHGRGVVHRDLKPANVMVTKSGVKLLDFGLAKMVGPAEAGPYVHGDRGFRLQPEVSAAQTVASPLTATGTILGTFQYMSPEQLEGREADARADIFALGVLIYEMLTGKKAFEGKSQASLIAAILERDPPR